MLAQPNFARTPSSALNIAELADRYTDLLYGIGRRYRLTPEECDDAAQSTWLALCQNAEHIRDPQCVAGWLATTMRRFSAATLRNRYRELPTSDSMDVFPRVDAAADVADTVAARHATSRLYQAIGQLPDRERRIIRLQLDRRSADTHRSAAPYRCRSAVSGRSAVAPSAASEPSSATSHSQQPHR